MDSDKDRKIKQSYLRQEIMELGYDSSSFLAFMKSQRPDGDNIDIWSLT